MQPVTKAELRAVFDGIMEVQYAACFRFSRHGVQVVPPSAGARLPQRMQSPASTRCFWRRLLLARPAPAFRDDAGPPLRRGFPAAFAAA